MSFESPHLPKGPYASLVTVSWVGDRAADFADLLTVSETANEPPQDEGNSFNSPRNLAMEATYINHNFSQHCLRMVRSWEHSVHQPQLLPTEHVLGRQLWVVGLDRTDGGPCLSQRRSQLEVRGQKA